jgi:hypothetical protein
MDLKLAQGKMARIKKAHGLKRVKPMEVAFKCHAKIRLGKNTVKTCSNTSAKSGKVHKGKFYCHVHMHMAKGGSSSTDGYALDGFVEKNSAAVHAAAEDDDDEDSADEDDDDEEEDYEGETDDDEDDESSSDEDDDDE